VVEARAGAKHYHVNWRTGGRWGFPGTWTSGDGIAGKEPKCEHGRAWPSYEIRRPNCRHTGWYMAGRKGTAFTNARFVVLKST